MRVSFRDFSLGLAFFGLLAGRVSADDNRHGLVSSRNCPYSCQTQQIPKSDCRDWRIGSICYVENLLLPPNSSGDRIPAGSNAPDFQSRQSGAPTRPRGGPQDFSTSSQWSPSGAGVGECENLSARDLGRPRAFIGSFRNIGTSYYSDRFRVTGSVEGVCLVDAGLFEGGRKVESIGVRSRRRFQRYEFDFQTRSGSGAEIRVFNSAGEGDVVPIFRPNQNWGNSGNWSPQGSGNNVGIYGSTGYGTTGGFGSTGYGSTTGYGSGGYGAGGSGTGSWGAGDWGAPAPSGNWNPPQQPPPAPPLNQGSTWTK